MKRLIEFGTICIVTLVLTGCSGVKSGVKPDESGGFPSERLYLIDNCHPIGCGVLENGAELAFVKEISGENWRLWQKMPNGGDSDMSEVCTGTIDGDKFRCARCGPEGIFTVAKVDSSECSFDHCVTFEHSGPNCPSEGSGTGGHN